MSPASRFFVLLIVLALGAGLLVPSAGAAPGGWTSPCNSGPSPVPVAGPVGVTIELSWALTGWPTGTASLGFGTPAPLDLDGNGTPDADATVKLDAWTPVGGGLHRSLAIDDFLTTVGSTLVRDSKGLDYAPLAVPVPPPPSSLDPLFIELGIARRAGSPTWPKGTFDLAFRVDYSDSTALDVHASMAADQFAPRTVAWIFSDEGRSVLSAGFDTRNDANAPITLPAFGADVSITRRDGTRLAPSFSARATTPSGVGFPGRMAFAQSPDCSQRDDWMGLRYDAAAIHGDAPDAFDVRFDAHGSGDLDGDGTFEATERTTYLDLRLKELPDTLSFRLTDADADVNANGIADDSVDLNADGVLDALAWSHLQFRQSGSAPLASGDVVFASNPLGSTGDPFYLAVSAPKLPRDVAVDMAGDVQSYDSDGDGLPDGATRPLDRAAGELCAKTWTTYPGTCGAPAVPASGIDFVTANRLPAVDSAGAFPQLHSSFSPTPSDLAHPAQIAAHFDPTPKTYVSATFDDVAGSMQVGGNLTGIRSVVYQRAAGTAVTVIQSRGVTTAGAEATFVRPTGTSQLWTSVADLSDTAGVAVDGDPVPVDGDPSMVGWIIGSRTGAAFAVDDTATGGDKTISHAAGWIGTGAGVTDGLPFVTQVLADLEGPQQSVATTSSDTAHLVASVETATEAQRAAGYVTEGRLELEMPKSWEAYWETDAENLKRADFTTCTEVTKCHAAGIDLALTTHLGKVDNSALAGVELPQPPPGSGVFGDFRDYPADYADWATFVLRGDPVPIKKPQTPGPKPPPDRSSWGVGLQLERLDTFAIARSKIMSGSTEAFVRTDLCLDAETRDSHFGMGMYYDRGTGTTPVWADTDLVRPGSQELDAQLELNTGVGGRIGDLTPAQRSLVTGSPGSYALAELVRLPCGVMTQHTADPAPGNPRTPPKVTTPASLVGRVRVGTDQTLDLMANGGLESRPVDVRAEDGIEAAIYSPDGAESSTLSDALDAAARLPLPGWLEIRQPILLGCGQGSASTDICAGIPTFDQTDRTEFNIAIRSSAGSEGFGRLDLEYIGEPEVDRLGNPTVATDTRGYRVLGHFDRIPANLTIDGSLDRRDRDQAVNGEIRIIDEDGKDLGNLSLQVRDDYDPAEWGDPSESTNPANRDKPLLDLELTGAGSELDLVADLMSAGRGDQRTAFGPQECVYDPIVVPGFEASHVTNFDLAPDGSGWPEVQARLPGDVRRPYLHGSIDLQGAENIAFRTDSRPLDEQRVDGTRIWFGSDQPTSGDLYLLSSVQQHDTEEFDAYFSDGWLEYCLDLDVPVNLEWSDAHRFGVGINGVKMSMSMDEADVAAGGDVRFALRERIEDNPSFSHDVSGVFAHELSTNLDMPWGGHYYTGWYGERFHVPLIDEPRVGLWDDIDPDSPPTWEYWQLDELSVQDDFVAGDWEQTGLDEDGDDRHGTAIFDLLVHDDMLFGLDHQSAFWGKISDRYLPVLDANCIDCGGGVDDGQQRFAFATLDYPATSLNDSHVATPFVLPHVCGAAFIVGSDDLLLPSFGRLTDGTTFRFSTHWDSVGGLRVDLVARFANGEVRFIRNLLDQHGISSLPGCARWDLHSSLVVTEAGRIRVDINAENSGNGTSVTRTWILDASGNGGKASGALTASLPTATVNQAVTFTGMAPSADFPVCTWLPGDGSVARIDPADPTHLTYRYSRPGTYVVLQSCSRWDNADDAVVRERSIGITP